LNKSRVKTKSIKKERTSEKKKIKSEKRGKTEASGNDAETRPKEEKKIKMKSRQPEKTTPRRGVRAVARIRERKRGVNIGVATLKKMRGDIRKARKINCVRIRLK